MNASQISSPTLTATRMGPVLLYELNEVPWRVFDWYQAQRPDSTVAALLADSACYTTRTHDQGELHPWSTWPTLHRGVYNTDHKILFINQDKACAGGYPPLWETLADRGVRVGVFGSLQSFPIPAGQRYCFYVPDTFAPSPETLPGKYSAFQAINLRQTKADGAIAQPVQVDRSTLRDLMRLPSIGVRPRTFATLAGQLVREKLNPAYRARRALLQAPVAFDVFLHAYRHYRPEFCTFFTNHVAGAMHRYWRYAFPEDFGCELSSADDRFKRETLLMAMDIADQQLRILKEVVDRDDGELVIATSMGQEAIERGGYLGELRLTEPEKMMKAIGFQRRWKDLLAMQPDFNFMFDSPEDAAEFMRSARRLRSPSGQCLWHRFRQEGRTVNMGLGRPADVLSDGFVQLAWDTANAQPRRLPLAELGISKIARDPGTGYHQPLGCLIWYGDRARENQGRKELELVRVRDMILDAVLSRAGKGKPAQRESRPSSQHPERDLGTRAQ
jgi:hypothetical protein